jgi:hypothetical protein
VRLSGRGWTWSCRGQILAFENYQSENFEGGWKTTCPNRCCVSQYHHDPDLVQGSRPSCRPEGGEAFCERSQERSTGLEESSKGRH